MWSDVWKTAWFNIAVLVVYTLASFALATVVSPNPKATWIFGAALAYGCGNVHFVVWFTAYTRWKKEAQDHVGAEAVDELTL